MENSVVCETTDVCGTTDVCETTDVTELATTTPLTTLGNRSIAAEKNESMIMMNMKFKGVFTNNNNSLQETMKIDNVNNFLEKESKHNKSESWNKRDKTDKIKLLNAYVDTLATTTHKLSAIEVVELKKYLVESIDKKKLQHVKDVTCDKLTGKIISIPTLHFNGLNRKFTLKRTEKRVSTLKTLGKGKKVGEANITS